MILNLKGSTKKTRKLVESAVWDYAERLMGKRLAKTLELTINLTWKLADKKVQKDFASGMSGTI